MFEEMITVYEASASLPLGMYLRGQIYHHTCMYERPHKKEFGVLKIGKSSMRSNKDTLSLKLSRFTYLLPPEPVDILCCM